MGTKALVCALALATPLFGVAQFDFGGGDSGPAWGSFKLNTKTRVKPNFQNTSVDMIVAWYSKTSGITIVKDPALTGTLSVVSAKPISLNDAFSHLQPCNSAPVSSAAVKFAPWSVEPQNFAPLSLAFAK